MQEENWAIWQCGRIKQKASGNGILPWRDIGRALRDIGYEKGVVMEPFLLQGGEVARDCKVWREFKWGMQMKKMLDRYNKRIFNIFET